MMKLVYNPFLNNFEYIQDEVQALSIGDYVIDLDFEKLKIYSVNTPQFCEISSLNILFSNGVSSNYSVYDSNGVKNVNVNGFEKSIVFGFNHITNHTILFPNKSGTVAMLSDISKYVIVNTNYNVLLDDRFIEVTSPVTITLPNPVNNLGKCYTIINSSSGVVSISEVEGTTFNLISNNVLNIVSNNVMYKKI